MGPGSRALVLSAVLSLGACGGAAQPSASTAPSGRGAAAPAVVWKNVGFESPESVVYDDVADRYLVSNVKGFISRLTPDGEVEALKWIESGKNGATFVDGPSGLALQGDLLYAADVRSLRIFDRKTGAPVGEVPIPGVTALNDVAATPDGRVLVSDTGVKFKEDGSFEPTGTDAVYVVDRAKNVKPLAKAADLGMPNGVTVGAGKTWVVTMGSGELFSLDESGAKHDAQKLPSGQLDGVVALGGELLLSSWAASAVYRGTPGGAFVPVIENVRSPADIGLDTKRRRVLVPLFLENEVRAYDVKP
jgi:hypothetical protein